MTEINNHGGIVRNISARKNVRVVAETEHNVEAPLDLNLVKLLFVAMIPVVAYAFSWILFSL